jgi:beta-xylosidase
MELQFYKMKSMSRLVKLSATCFLLLFLFISCLPLNKAGLSENETPILLADPTIFYHDGTYYLYGTGSPPYNKGFVVYTSKDLKKWSGPIGVSEGFALKQGDAFGNAKFWAPQVFKHNGKFYMAYTANEHIAVAESVHPLGPFKQKEIKPLASETKQIDPFIFIDDNGKKYLYYVIVANGGNRIYVAEMNDDLLSVKNGTETKCIEADSQWENTDKDKWSVTEGPTVIRRNKLYYLIYSANHFRSPDYAVGYAVSERPMGPWKKYSGNPIIHKKHTGFNGNGHGDLIQGRKNEWLYVLHTHQSETSITPRKTGIIKGEFVKDDGTGIDQLKVDGKTFRFLSSTDK